MSGPTLVLLCGFAIGLAYGAVGLLSGFCLLSSLRNLLNENDGRRAASFALAMATAIFGAQLLHATGTVDLSKSLYLQPSFSPVLIFAGGLIFGFGMVLANGCGSRAAVLLGGGNLRSFVVLVTLGIAAQATLKGLLAPPRVSFLQWSSVTLPANSYPATLAASGVTGAYAHIAAAVSIGGALLAVAMSLPGARKARGQIAAGFAMGLLVTAGWYITGHLGADDFSPQPVGSLTFVAPVADSVQYVMLATAFPLTFGVITVFGVLLGSAATAVATGAFKLQGFQSPVHMLRSMAGAALMGIGGAMAYGCSVGQGLTGMSTLAVPSFLALLGIVLGISAGLRGPLRVPALPPAA